MDKSLDMFASDNRTELKFIYIMDRNKTVRFQQFLIDDKHNLNRNVTKHGFLHHFIIQL